MRDSVTLSIAFPYRIAYKASLVLVLYSPLQIAVSSVFPLAGLFILYLLVVRHQALALHEILYAVFLVLLCFLFTPIILALTLFLGRRRNPLSEGPFTYTLDSSGIHASSSAFENTIKWPVIRRVVETRSFLFLFVAPGRAISLPVAQLQIAGVLSDVREIVRNNTVVPSA